MHRPLSRHYIREWREHRGLTQDALAAQIADFTGFRLSGPQLSRIEGGLSPFNQRQLDACAVILRCTVTDLVSRPPAKVRDQAFIADIIARGVVAGLAEADQDVGELSAENLAKAIAKALAPPRQDPQRTTPDLPTFSGHRAGQAPLKRRPVKNPP